MTSGDRPLRVLIAGAWDEGPGYPRTRSHRAALERLPVRVALCHEPPPAAGQSKQKLLRSPWRWPAAWRASGRARRSLQTTLELALREFQPDVVFVPYPGHSAVHWVRDRFDGRIVLDLFLSAHDTVVEDRRLVREGSFGARWLARLDRRACAAADVVLMDTPQGAQRAIEQTGLVSQRFDWVPIGDPDAPEMVEPSPTTEGPLELLYLGTGVPLHGLRHLLDAFDPAWGADDGERPVPENWRLRLIGGDDRSRQRAAELPGVQVGPRFVDVAAWGQALAQCHAVAGVFGTSPKADRVVPFKVVHGLAAGRVVLTAATTAVTDRLRPGECVTVPAGDGQAIRRALLELDQHPARRRGVEVAARAAYEREFAPAALAERWRTVLGLPEASAGRAEVVAGDRVVVESVR